MSHIRIHIEIEGPDGMAYTDGTIDRELILNSPNPREALFAEASIWADAAALEYTSRSGMETKR